MICKLCESPIVDISDCKHLTIKGEKYPLHKKCLRGATQTQLIKKGLIRADDRAWWSKL